MVIAFFDHNESGLGGLLVLGTDGKPAFFGYVELSLAGGELGPKLLEHFMIGLPLKGDSQAVPLMREAIDEGVELGHLMA